MITNYIEHIVYNILGILLKLSPLNVFVLILVLMFCWTDVAVDFDVSVMMYPCLPADLTAGRLSPCLCPTHSPNGWPRHLLFIPP